MTSAHPVSDFFIAGGTLTPDAPSYVKRTADDDLFRHVLNKEYCYVLTARQMGKSSLMIRTAQRLSKEGVRSAIVDLTIIGSIESEDQWYKGILTQIKRPLSLGMNPVAWWEERGDIPNIQKFIEFFEVILSEVNEPIVIFMDEIDSTLKLDFRDNFFAGIRAIYNARAENPDLNRITFVLLGVASPSDLIKDRKRTPFNIGREISLTNLSRNDSNVLVGGLEQSYPGSGEKIFDRIFYWTDGHPYFTQKLCMEIVDKQIGNWGNQEIDQLVTELFLSGRARNETNIRDVQDRLLHSPNRTRLLNLHKKILQGGIRQDAKSPLQNELRLSGLVNSNDGVLNVNNRIYETVFNLQWVEEYAPKNIIRIIAPYLAGISLLTLFIILYNLKILPIVENYYAGKFATAQLSSEKLINLASLFSLHGFLSDNDYDSQAIKLYFDENWEDQTRIFQDSSITLNEKEENLPIVIKGLYVTMANSEGGQDSSELLLIMNDALKDLSGGESSDLGEELRLWLEARKAPTDQEALDLYDQAINLNNINPATHYERALVAIRLEEYEKALLDLETALGLARNLFEGELSTPAQLLPPDTKDYRSDFYTVESVRSKIDQVLQGNLQNTNFMVFLIQAKTETNAYPNLEAAESLKTVEELVDDFATKVSMAQTESSDAQTQISDAQTQISTAHTQVYGAQSQLSMAQTQEIDAQSQLYVAQTQVEAVKSVSIVVSTISNCRSGTGTEFERIVQIPQGESVVFIGRNGRGDYLYIKWNSYECWISSDLVKFDLTPIPTVLTPIPPTPVPAFPGAGPGEQVYVTAPRELHCPSGNQCNANVSVIWNNPKSGNHICVYVQPQEVPGQDYYKQFEGLSGTVTIGAAPTNTPFAVVAISTSSNCTPSQVPALPSHDASGRATIIRIND